MPLIEIVPAAPEHVDPIASDPREADVAELWAVGRVTPEQAMVNGLRGSARAWTGMVDGVPACMFGATPYSILGGMGTPWMIGSNALGAWSAQKALLREARPVVGQMQAMFPKLLFNVVDQRNVQAQRWLRWLGFQLMDPTPIGPDGLPFIPFWRTSGV